MIKPATTLNRQENSALTPTKCLLLKNFDTPAFYHSRFALKNLVATLTLNREFNRLNLHLCSALKLHISSRYHPQSACYERPNHAALFQE
jgi:hypothetical protein